MKRILVIGDSFFDVYSYFVYKKKCPDAQNISAYFLNSQLKRLGGAANVAINIASLTKHVVVDFISAIDFNMAAELKKYNVDVSSSVYTEKAGEKNRIYLDGDISSRLDMNVIFNEEDINGKLTEYLSSHNPDLVVISDYSHGIISDSLLNIFEDHLKKVMIVDTKFKSLEQFNGCLAIKLNSDEYNSVLLSEHSPERFCKGLIVTLGENGVFIKLQKKYSDVIKTDTLKIKSFATDIVDVCGCGDSFLAGMAASLIYGNDLISSMYFGNAAAANVISKSRTSVADYDETKKILEINI